MRHVLNGQHALAYARSGTEFNELLNNVRDRGLIARNDPQPTCFISYARPDNHDELRQLQDWIVFLANSLEKLHITVVWDAGGQDTPRTWMQSKIRESQWVILVGTPLYKAKANIQDKGVYIEMQEISNGVQARTLSVLPLIYEGNWGNAIPEVIQNQAFAIDTSHPDYDYRTIMSPALPVGIIPRIYKNLQQNDVYIGRWKNFSSERRNFYYTVDLVPAEEAQRGDPMLNQFSQQTQNPDMQYKRGLEHMKKGDKDQARVFFERAAQQQHTEAEYNFGLCLMNNWGQGGQHYQNAESYFKRAAAKDHAASEYNIGLLYKDGKVGEGHDYGAALYWFDKAVHSPKHGPDYAAAFNLGLLFIRDDLAEEAKDYQKAEYYFRMASNGGDVAAKFNLALLYMRGLGGVKRDLMEASRLLTEAIIRGEPKAREAWDQLNVMQKEALEQFNAMQRSEREAWEQAREAREQLNAERRRQQQERESEGGLIQLARAISGRPK